MENKFWENFKKIAGGLTVTFSVFFLLLAVSFFKGAPNLVATSLKTVATDPAPTKPVSNDTLLSGKFNIETSGNVVYSYGDNKLYHYKTIKDTALVNLEKDPRLMLEIKDDQGRIVWQKTEISWRDASQGILFFHFKTVTENGTETKAQNFTGNYQVILE